MRRTNAQKSRAKRYRARHKEGVEPLNPQELAWFERYEAGMDLEMDTPVKESASDSDQDVPGESDDAGRSPADTDSSGSPTSDVTVADLPAPDAIPVAAAPPPPPPPPPPKAPPPPRAPKAAPLPPPPRSIRPSHESQTESDWQSKYWSGTVGREGTCKLIAEQVVSLLGHMQNQCRDVGVDPIIELDKVSGTFVIAADKLLPPEFVVEPEHIAAATVVSTVTQRWMHRKKIAEAQKSFAEKKDSEARKADAERDRIAADKASAAKRYADEKAAAEVAAKAGPAPTVPRVATGATGASGGYVPPAPVAGTNYNSSPVGQADEDRLA